MKPLVRADPAVNEAVVAATKRLAEALATLQTYMPSETGRSDAGRRAIARGPDRPRRGRDPFALGACRQRGGALPRLVPEPGDVRAAGLRDADVGDRDLRRAGVRAPRALLDAVYAAAAATGLAGLCFHAYNIAKRPGGFSWLNFFYSAPIGAPMAMALAGFSAAAR